LSPILFVSIIILGLFSVQIIIIIRVLLVVVVVVVLEFGLLCGVDVVIWLGMKWVVGERIFVVIVIRKFTTVITVA